MSGLLPSKFSAFFHNDETTWSFISRVAFLNKRSPGEFCRDIGAPLREIAAGDQIAIDRLALVTGSSASAIRARTFILEERNRYRFGDELVAVQGLDFRSLRFCPECIRSDADGGSGLVEGRPYRRSAWMFSSYRTCHLHKTELVCVPAGDGPSALDFAAAIQSHLQATLSSADQRPAHEAPLEEYIVGRLAGTRPESNWLNGFRIDAAARMCELTGGTELFKDVMLAHMTPAMLRQSASSGFMVASAGPEAVRALLEQVQLRMPEPARTASSAWPSLQAYLTRANDDPEYDALRDIAFDQAVRSMPLGPGDLCLGREVVTRHIHSVKSAASETGMHHIRLRRLLEKKGIISSEAAKLHSGRILFNAAAAKPFLDMAKDALPLETAARYLNVRFKCARQMAAAGLLEPLAAVDEGPLTQHAIPKRELDEFLSGLTARAIEIRDDEPQFLAIAPAAGMSRHKIVDIVKAILTGGLREIRYDPHESGFKSVLVSLDEIAMFFTNKAPAMEATSRGYRSAFSYNHAASVIKTSTTVVGALAKHGIIETVLRGVPGSESRTTVPDPDSVDDFAQRYISLRNLSEETGIHPGTLRCKLEKVGLAPAFPKELVGTRFYDRAALPDLR
ncbi:hypothetical protein GTW25_19730 [Aliihoeflea aestuarii]|jgi:hypothetical protein|uniref:TniQ family protein n=1 Tax=Aliihoeflea aestuarii TaxID=453840 RepID=UPI002095AE24|nr:TniQ family protein [Aliihoeflea aestuarii]MCO6393253.1 hypothetical protein [Aliihoeflea aestuarii]